jgi:Ca-activated chloride channel family protein
MRNPRADAEAWASSIAATRVDAEPARDSPQAVANATAACRGRGRRRARNGNQREWFAQEPTMDPLRDTRKPRLFSSPRLVRQRRLGFTFLLLALAARVGAQTPEPEGLQFATADGGWETAAALDTAVHFRIRGLLAEVTVEQTYRNDGDGWLEGRYLLPLPENAAVHALNLQVGDRIVVGEVREKEEAQAIYQAAAEQGQVAGLVEQNRPNLFRTAVANIAPGAEVQVRIGYWQRVDYRDGAFSIALPLTLTPRYESGAGAAAAALPAVAAARAVGRGLEPSVSLRVDLTAGVALSGIESPTHEIAVRASGDGHVVTLLRGAEASDRDFELRWIPIPAATPHSALFVERRADADYAFAMLMPPTAKVDALPRELLLVIDTSGSMAGQPLEQAQAALIEALARLRPGDRFNLIQFNSTSEQLFANAVPADAGHLEVASDWIGALVANNGTEMAPALALAFGGSAPSGYVRQVVFITDAAVGDEAALFSQIERERGDARLFPVGIGSAPNDHFLRKAAELGRGSELMIRAPDQVVAQMDRLFAKLDRPALSDVELHWPSGAEVFPSQLPDLYAGEPLLAVARLGRATGTLKARGWSAQGEWQDALQLERGFGIDGVARLWGRSKIDALEDALRQGADETAVRAEIVALAVEHRLVSRYTSLVAVDRTPARPEQASLNSLRFDNAAPHGSLAFAQGSTDARSRLGIALACLLLGLALFQRRGTSGAH